MESSLFRRVLPPCCVGLTTKEGRAIFNEALAAGGCEGSFFTLLSFLHTQAEPAFCGLASLTTVLNALSVDPLRQWHRSQWRFFEEEHLDCCVALEEVRRVGVVLEELACLARCNGAAVLAMRRAPALDGDAAGCCPGERCCTTLPGCDISTVVDFEEAVRAACCLRTPQTHVIVSISRQALGQTGSGHYAPVGAWCPATEAHPAMVLLLDTARFKYEPHW